MNPVINQCRNGSPEQMPRHMKRETAMEMLLPEVLVPKPHMHGEATLKPDTLEYGHLRTAFAPRANRLLAKLPAADYQRLAPHLEPVALPLGWAIHEVGDQLNYAYFPTEGIFARLNVLSDGSTSEVAITGNEGLIGVSLYMGAQHTTCRAVVQLAGYAYRLPTNLLLEEFERGGAFQHLLLRYTQAVMTQVAQTAMCYRRHSIDQQLCRLLLKFQDRVPGNEIVMTQEMIATMMGVRREGVTEAAGHLQSAGLIIYRRGRITVLDRPAIEKRACECYAVVKKELDRLL
jgi:CRP-like cAMP-binding protein